MSKGRHSKTSPAGKVMQPIMLAFVFVILVGGAYFAVSSKLLDTSAARKKTEVPISSKGTSNTQNYAAQPTEKPTNAHKSADANPDKAETAELSKALSETRTVTSPLAGKIIAIDPGHQAKGDFSLEPIGPGASDTKPKVAAGTRGTSTHIPESKTVLEIGLQLKTSLESQGATVVMTRSSQDVNVANSERAEIANNAKANLLIRLHCDGNGDSHIHGISTLVPATNNWTSSIVKPSKAAGSVIQKALIHATNANDRGVVQRADLSGFNWCKVPAILIEMGFMTNPHEDAKLNSSQYQKKLIDGMTQGCIDYFANE